MMVAVGRGRKGRRGDVEVEGERSACLDASDPTGARARGPKDKTTRGRKKNERKTQLMGAPGVMGVIVCHAWACQCATS